MYTNSIYLKLNSTKYYNDYDKAWKLLERFYIDYYKTNFIKKNTIKELFKLNKILKKGKK